MSVLHTAYNSTQQVSSIFDELIAAQYINFTTITVCSLTLVGKVPKHVAIIDSCAINISTSVLRWLLLTEL
jgi:hypothetical protein